MLLVTKCDATIYDAVCSCLQVLYQIRRVKEMRRIIGVVDGYIKSSECCLNGM